MQSPTKQTLGIIREALALNTFKQSKLQEHQGDTEMEMHAGAGSWENTYSVTRVWDNIKRDSGGVPLYDFSTIKQ